jgi:hypothetical protein
MEHFISHPPLEKEGCRVQKKNRHNELRLVSHTSYLIYTGGGRSGKSQFKASLVQKVSETPSQQISWEWW